MDPSQLYVIAIHIRDKRRRARIRRLLSIHGQPINRDIYEIATDPRGLRGLQAALAMELAEEDSARLYPICLRCRRAVRIHGEGELECPPPAYIF